MFRSPELLLGSVIRGVLGDELRNGWVVGEGVVRLTDALHSERDVFFRLVQSLLGGKEDVFFRHTGDPGDEDAEKGEKADAAEEKVAEQQLHMDGKVVDFSPDSLKHRPSKGVNFVGLTN